MSAADEAPGRRGVPLTLVLCVGLLAALLLAGVAGTVASSSPDGLNRVAEDHGVGRSTGASDGLLSGYRLPGVDSWVATAAAGVGGALVVGLLALVLVRVLRRRAAGTGAER